MLTCAIANQIIETISDPLPWKKCRCDGCKVVFKRKQSGRGNPDSKSIYCSTKCEQKAMQDATNERLRKPVSSARRPRPLTRACRIPPNRAQNHRKEVETWQKEHGSITEVLQKDGKSFNPKRWRVCVSFGTDPVTRKRIKVQRVVSGTKAEARKVRDQLRQEHERGSEIWMLQR